MSFNGTVPQLKAFPPNYCIDTFVLHKDVKYIFKRYLFNVLDNTYFLDTRTIYTHPLNRAIKVHLT